MGKAGAYHKQNKKFKKLSQPADLRFPFSDKFESKLKNIKHLKIAFINGYF